MDITAVPVVIYACGSVEGSMRAKAVPAHFKEGPGQQGAGFAFIDRLPPGQDVIIDVLETSTCEPTRGLIVWLRG